jgi:hypothetical protein
MFCKNIFSSGGHYGPRLSGDEVTSIPKVEIGTKYLDTLMPWSKSIKLMSQHRRGNCLNCGFHLLIKNLPEKSLWVQRLHNYKKESKKLKIS